MKTCNAKRVLMCATTLDECSEGCAQQLDERPMSNIADGNYQVHLIVMTAAGRQIVRMRGKRLLRRPSRELRK